MSPEAFDEEASGFALVPDGDLPEGWRTASAEEAADVWGRGNTSGRNPENTKTTDHQTCGNACRGSGGSGGMARYFRPLDGREPHFDGHARRIHPTAGPRRVVHRTVYPARRLSASDLPVLEPRLAVDDGLVRVRHGRSNQRLPARDGVLAGAAARKRMRTIRRPRRATRCTGTAGPRWCGSRTAPSRYERRLTDGSFEEYGQPDGALTFPRKVFLTRMVDAAGNAVSLTYDGSLRLVAIADAVGQVTTLQYEHPTDPLLLTRVTDPFGREALFAYNAQGLLEQITDVQGLQSSFEYVGDFVSKLTTPYGDTAFELWVDGIDRWIEITDALGGVERIEYRNRVIEIPNTEPVVPQGFSNALSPVPQYPSTGTSERPTRVCWGITRRRGSCTGCTRRTRRRRLARSRARRDPSRIASGTCTMASPAPTTWGRPRSPRRWGVSWTTGRARCATSSTTNEE